MKGLKLTALALVVGIGLGTSVIADATTKVGVTIYQYNDDFISLMRQEIKKEAQKFDLELLMNDSQGSQTKQNDQVQSLITKAKVKALVVNLVDPRASRTIIGKAEIGNIPVVFFNKDPGVAMQKYDQAYYVGANTKEAGVIQATLIEKQWKANPALDVNGDGKIQLAILEGEPWHQDSEARTKNVLAQLNAKGMPTEIVFMDTAMWDRNKAKDKMLNWLTQEKFQTVEMIVSNNDSMAIGALEALKAKGKKLPIFGVDALPEALQLIKTGELAGTVLNDGKIQGQAVAQLINNLVNKKPITDGINWRLEGRVIEVPYVGIDADNLMQFLP